jgi:exopolysaccharide biosynthesis WecB/TagA/CpsF family protein
MSGEDAASRQARTVIPATAEVRFRRVVMGGLPVAVLDRAETANLTVAAAISRRGSGRPCLFFTATNGQVISLCASNPELKQLFESADVVSADGMSVVFASRFGATPPLPERVATTDGFHDAARIAEKQGASFYLLGGSDIINQRAALRVREIYPRLNLAGRRHGYFRPDEEAAVLDAINAAAPDVLWVGFGAPREQHFVRRNLHRLTNVGVARTCGGLFDFIAGKNRRAPGWMQKAGFEWAFRISQEPMRLTWRYLTTNPHAAYWLLRSRAPASDGSIEAGAV